MWKSTIGTGTGEVVAPGKRVASRLTGLTEYQVSQTLQSTLTLASRLGQLDLSFIHLCVSILLQTLVNKMLLSFKPVSLFLFHFLSWGFGVLGFWGILRDFKGF